MNMQSTEIASLPSFPELVDEYDTKRAGIPAVLAAYDAAGVAVKMAATLGGEHGGETIDVDGRGTDLRTLEKNLLRSAWRRAWVRLRLPEFASANDKTMFEKSLVEPPEFTLDNVRATFGPYAADPRAVILRGMAEVFADLDPAYKSHEKVKIGVKGLPKRVVIHGFGEHWSTYGRGPDKVRDIVNALATYQKRKLLTRNELDLLCGTKTCDQKPLDKGGTYPDPALSPREHMGREERGEEPKTIYVDGRGVWLKRFNNGNGHLFFSPDALRDINMALAAFYGDVLADSPEADAERPAPRHTGTAVSKDLQFYPTPAKVIEQLLARTTHDWDSVALSGKRVLEPSCGDGRIMDALRAAGAIPVGIEVDPRRAAEAKAKGHHVMCANFLTTRPSRGLEGAHWLFPVVVMNPPFAGKHYAKHVRHAMQWLEPGGKIYAILPATARYDHGLLDDLDPSWRDLPVGAFAESGTNIATTICTITKPKKGNRNG